MGGLGIGELLLILIILLVVFGGAKLPQIGDALGRAIRSFKRGVVEQDRISVTPTADREVKSQLSGAAAAGADAKAAATRSPAGDEIEDATVEPKPKA